MDSPLPGGFELNSASDKTLSDALSSSSKDGKKKKKAGADDNDPESQKNRKQREWNVSAGDSGIDFSDTGLPDASQSRQDETLTRTVLSKDEISFVIDLANDILTPDRNART